jgi:hypothetical protein
MLIWRGVMGVGVIVGFVRAGRVSVPLIRTRTGVSSELHFWEFSCSLLHVDWRSCVSYKPRRSYILSTQLNAQVY